MNSQGTMSGKEVLAQLLISRDLKPVAELDTCQDSLNSSCQPKYAIEPQPVLLGRSVTRPRGADSVGKCQNWISDVHNSHTKPDARRSTNIAEVALKFACGRDGDPELLRRAILNAMALDTHDVQDLKPFKEKLANMLLQTDLTCLNDSWDEAHLDVIDRLIGPPRSLPEQLRKIIYVDDNADVSGKEAFATLLLSRELKAVSSRKRWQELGYVSSQ